MMSPDAVDNLIINLATARLVDATSEEEPEAFAEARKIVERVYFMTTDEGENMTDPLELEALEAIDAVSIRTN